MRRYSYDRTVIAKTYNLQDMARDYVGDGKSPNMFFATDAKGKVLAVIASNKTDAVRFATSSGAYLLEDRKHGEVWTSPEFERAQEAKDDE